MNYADFLDRKTHLGGDHGFDPTWMPESLFDFQRHLVEWSLRKGRAAIFADCGLGKSAMQLTWAENVVRHTNKRVLILTPLAVAAQTVREGEKFGIECKRSAGALDGKIIVTNYQKLHHFNPADFVGVVCDESSILKNFDGATKSAVTDFMRKLPYRLLCTATAAPNDYIELGTSSEAIGELGFSDMLSRFFRKSETTMSRSHEYRAGVYRFRGHAERDFWRWVCSWARACRRPSDLGFDDSRFDLPELRLREHVVRSAKPRGGFLFDLPAVTLAEQRDERRRTLVERCELAASLVADTGEPAVCWGYLNPECDMIENLVDDAVQVSGSDSDDRKEEVLSAFSRGQVRVLVTKPIIGAWGLNWQHCAHQTFFPSHSFEQYYQSIRRSWRFGQSRPVVVDMIASEGERGVLASIERKAMQAEAMFAQLVELMNREIKVAKRKDAMNAMEVPSWL